MVFFGKMYGFYMLFSTSRGRKGGTSVTPGSVPTVVRTVVPRVVPPPPPQTFRAVLLRVDDYNAARIKMTAEMADSSNLAKTLVIKARETNV